MAMENKTKNVSRNLMFGTILKIYQLLMPFIIRTIIIKILGMKYAGLNSLFNSILQVLNIAELGVGSALVFSMYRPIAENDTKKICALMQLYKIYYRVIGAVILGIGICLTPILPKLINGEVPSEINLYILYYLNLVSTVLSYWLFAYKNSLFQAHQRNDIISKVTIITNTIMYFLQIILLTLMKNYYLYVFIILITQVLNNILIAFVANKFYPNYNAQGKLEDSEVKAINSSIKDLFYSQLGLVVTTSVDSIIISAFLGLVELAIYQNYYYILNALIAFFTIFYQSCRASIGTNFIIKSVDDNFKDFKFITFIVMGVLSFCISCLLCMYQPFIKKWVGQANMLDNKCVFLFALYFFVYEIMFLFENYKGATGKWHEDRFRPLIAIVNLITNIILVNYIGIYGILLSTIGSYIIINIPWLYRRLFIDVFEKKYKLTYTKYLIQKLLLLLIIVSSNVFLCSLIKTNGLFIQLVANLCVCTLVSSILYILFSIKDDEFDRAMSLAKKMFKSSISDR